MGSGCAFLDYDGDGWLDLFLVNGRALPGKRLQVPAVPHLYHNRRDGSFDDVTAGSGLDRPIYGMGCAAADYDGDGRVDLYLSACLDADRLYRNLGGGRFQDVTDRTGLGDRRWGTSCAWLDYDRDGYADLFVCRYVRYALGESDRNCFAPDGSRMYCDPRRLPPETCLLYHNERGRRFRDVSVGTGVADRFGKALGVAVCDVDDDGWPDLLVANDTEPNFLFHNTVGGPDGRRFEEVGMEAGVAMPENGEPRSGMGIDLADLQNDGRYAVLISNFNGEGLSLYQQDRPRAFAFTERAYEAGLGAESLNRLGFGLVFFDYDNDGLTDAFVANGHIQPEIHRQSTELTYAERPLLFRQSAAGQFTETGHRFGGPFAREEVGRGAASGDWDNDGDVDLLVSNNGGPAELLRNDAQSPPGTPRPHWLQLRLIGSPPNTDALGARVIVRAGTLVQRRTVHTGSSYLSQSMTRLHFGLGSQARAESISIRWPAGSTTTLRDVPADRMLTVYQSATAPSSQRHSGR